MTAKKLGNVDLKQFIDGLHDYLARALQPIGERLDALEDVLTNPDDQSRLARIEQRVSALEKEKRR